MLDEGVPALLAGLVEDPEDVAGDLWVRWESDRDGVLDEGPPDDNGATALYIAHLSRGDHLLSLTVTDPLGLEATAWVTVGVNGAPTAPTVTLSPTSPTGDDALVATLSAPAVDPDGDALAYSYAWSRFGVPSGAPEEGDPLTCTASGSDLDGDTITYTFSWDLDGVEYTGASSSGHVSTVDGADVLDGQVWTCAAVADDGVDASEPGEDLVIVGAVLAATCQEIRDALPTATDGDYTLYVGNDVSQPWSVYCHDMEGTPVEYLPLPNTGGDFNFSQYTAGGWVPGTDVRTLYTRVRIDPTSFLVDISDQTFSSSTGSVFHGTDVLSMPYGVAMSCDGADSGLGNVDLTGTEFVVQSGAFLADGWLASGTATYSSDGKVVDLTGGGRCGWIVSGELFDPYNDKGDFQLPLEFEP